MQTYTYKQLYISPLGKPVVITLSASSLGQLIEKVVSLRARKILSPRDVQSVTKEVTARHVIAKPSLASQPVAKTRTDKLTLQSVMRGGRALVDIIKGDVVEQAELQRRADICGRCKLISDTKEACTSCAKRGLAKFARNLAVSYGRNFLVPKIIAIHLRPVKTASLTEFYCGVCSCSCLNLCLSKSKNFLDKEDANLRPDNCWAKPNGRNWQA